GGGHPEVHAPADEGAVKAFAGDADDGVHDAVEALRLAHNLRIAAEAPLPQLVADHGDGMRALPLIFAGKEAAAEHGRNADGVEVVGGNDAAGGALGPIADAECGAGDFADEERLAEGAASLEVLEIRPGERGALGFFARGAADG